MRAFAAALHKAGLAVHYLRLNDEDNQQDFVANLAILAQRYGATHIERQHADEYRLEHHLSTQLTRLGLDIRVVDSEHFYCRGKKPCSVLRIKPVVWNFLPGFTQALHYFIRRTG